MSSSSAIVLTDCAGRFLQQLCTLFGDEVPTEFVPATGRITFPFGACTLRAEGASLIIVGEGESADLDRLERVVGDHLARFGFREKLAVSWQRSDRRSRIDPLDEVLYRHDPHDACANPDARPPSPLTNQRRP